MKNFLFLSKSESRNDTSYHKILISFLKMTIVYISNIPHDVCEDALIELFTKNFNGYEVTIKQIPNKPSFAYVTYKTIKQAIEAISYFNYLNINGTIIYASLALSNFPNLKEDEGFVMVKNIDGEIPEQSLYNIFSKFGDILSFKVKKMSNEDFNQVIMRFDSHEKATNIAQEIDGHFINRKIISARIYIPSKAILLQKLPFDIQSKQKFEQWVRNTVRDDCHKMIFLRHPNNNRKHQGILKFDNPLNANNAYQYFQNQKVMCIKISNSLIKKKISELQELYDSPKQTKKSPKTKKG